MTTPQRRDVWLRWGGAAVAASVLGIVLAATSDHDRNPWISATLLLVVGWSFIAGGLTAWSRRPENRTGRLLAAVGFLFFVGFLNEANDSVLFTIGQATSAIVLAAFIHLLLAFPTGELRSRFERILIGGSYATAIVANVTTLMFDRRPGCDACPANELLVSAQPTAVNVLNAFFDAVGLAIVIGIIVLLVRHMRASTPAAHRRLALILGAGALALVLLGVGFAVDPASRRASSVIFDVGLLVFATVPFFFLTGLLRIRWARGGVAELLVEVRESAVLEDAEAGLRRVLRDPELRLAAWSPERGRFIDTSGLVLEEPDDERRVTSIVRGDEGEAVAVLVHDRALLDEAELLEGAVAAARLSLQRSRLQEELSARLLELQRERDFIFTVVNAAHVFHAVLDPAGRIVRFNDPLAEATGIADDERVRGKPFWDVFGLPEDAEELGAAILAGEADEREHRLRAADGSPLVFAWTIRPIPDARGRPTLLVSGLDVTERKRHEEELRRQRDFLRTVGDSTPSLMCVVGADGTVDPAGVNLAFANATGHGDETAIGRVFWELVVAPEEAAAVRDAFVAAVETGESPRIETPWLSADGAPLLVEWWTSSLASFREDTYLICGVDVTERTLQAEELRRSRSRLVEAGDAERRRLERNLHDGAQQRLVSLSLAIRLAQSRLASDPQGADELLSSASVELAFALQELRELARGLHPAVLADRGLRPALDALAERSPMPVELEVDVDERLPEAVEVAAYYVVSEALANVAKYAHATSVHVRVGRTAEGLALEVADDGIGGADPARGSGLRGLVDRVDALGGRIEFESPPGEGTRVTATLPVRSPVPQDAG